MKELLFNRSMMMWERESISARASKSKEVSERLMDRNGVDVDVWIFLPLGGKPVDLTTKKWINYNWKDNLMRNIATGHGAVVTFNLIWFE